jgi:hypothetical protein
METSTHTELDYRSYWEQAFPWLEYLSAEVQMHRELWEGVYRKTRMPDWVVERMREIGGEWKLLVISEDWCGDAVNLVPVLARFAEGVPEVEIRIVKRDENPELMDLYLTNGSRSIPLAIILSESFEPAGRWGPRPAELQERIVQEKQAGPRPAREIYRDARAWYARDRGERALRELLGIFAAASVPGA